MKATLLLLLLQLFLTAESRSSGGLNWLDGEPETGRKFYVDPGSKSPTEDGSLARPWKSIIGVNNNMSLFKPGDCIYFKKGQQFRGPLVISCSGTEVAPVTFSSYGTGPAPVLQYDFNARDTFSDRAVIYITNARHVVIEGYEITDTGIDSTDHTAIARVDNGISILQSSYIVLQNIRISRLGIGIVIQGDHNTVQHCTLYNMRMIVNDPAPDNDYGANGIVLSGAANVIQNNNISDNWGTSRDFQYDGGAIEFFGPQSDNRILYNTCYNNQGFMEFGSRSGGIADNNVIAYNLLINNGNVFYFNNSGKYALKISRVQFYNNDVIETAYDRPTTPYLFSSSSPLAANALIARNNIFCILRSLTLIKKTLLPGSFVHAYNVYKTNESVTFGFSVDRSEVRIPPSAALFSNTGPSGPLYWNYELAAGSIAIDFGINLNFSSDLRGRHLFSGKSVDAGAIEKIP